MRKLWLFFLAVSTAFTLHAQQASDSLLAIIKRNLSPDSVMKAYTFLASDLLRTDGGKAREYMHTAIILAKQYDRPDHLCGYYSILCSINVQAGVHDSATYYLNKMKMLAEENPELFTIQYNYNAAAGLYFKNQGRYKDALPFMLNAAKVSKKMNRRESLAGQYINIGNTYMLAGDYRKALSFNMQALKLFQDLNNQRGISFCYQNISNVFFELEQFDKSVEYANRSLKLKTQLKDVRGLGTAYTTLGKNYSATNRPLEAITAFQKALQIAQELNLKIEEAKIRVEMGKAYQFSNNIILAQQHLQSGRELAQSAGDTGIFYSAEAALHQLNNSRKQQKDRESELLAFLQRARDNGDKDDEAQNARLLSEFYEGHNDFQKALSYQKIYYAYRDSFVNAQVKVDINRLEQQYQSELKEQEITLLKKDQQLKTARLQRQQSMLIGGSALAAFVLILGFLLFHRYRFINNSRQQLAIEKMRNQIAKDLHDDIGSTLSSINIISSVMLKKAENAETETAGLREIKDNSAAVMESMSDIVWAINPANDSLDKVIYKMKEFAAEVLEPLDVNFRFETEGDLHKLSFTPEKRRDIYLVFKEAINNVAKYSEARNVVVKLRHTDRFLQLQVKDDGRGFDVEKQKRGNGLNNMQQRAVQMEGSLSFQAQPGAGSTINMQVPVT
ncbi:MAG: tetratricopeptide repeat-containing sensor histidine kinase [Flavisolibacter sp.]